MPRQVGSSAVARRLRKLRIHARRGHQGLDEHSSPTQKSPKNHPKIIQKSIKRAVLERLGAVGASWGRRGAVLGPSSSRLGGVLGWLGVLGRLVGLSWRLGGFWNPCSSSTGVKAKNIEIPMQF